MSASTLVLKKKDSPPPQKKRMLFHPMVHNEKQNSTITWNVPELVPERCNSKELFPNGFSTAYILNSNRTEVLSNLPFPSMSLLTPPIATLNGEKLFRGELHSQAQLSGRVTLGQPGFLRGSGSRQAEGCRAGSAVRCHTPPLHALKPAYLQSISPLTCFELPRNCLGALAHPSKPITPSNIAVGCSCRATPCLDVVFCRRKHNLLHSTRELRGGGYARHELNAQ